MPGAPEDAHSTTRASMASTEAYARGDYGRGDADADVNRAPSPMGTMTTAKKEVEEAPPMGCCAKMAKEMKKLGPQWRKREVYGKGKDGVKVVVRLNLTMYGGQGCFGPRQMLRRADMTKTPRALEAVGMSPEEYRDVFVEQLDAIENEHFPEGGCRGCIAQCPNIASCFFGSLLTVGCLIPFFCKREGEKLPLKEQRCKAFDAALREWQTNANARFEKYHVYVKTQSHSYLKSNGDKAQRVYQRWIVIALNDEDAAALSTEPHLSGLIQTNEPPCNCARQFVDETTGYCTHPYPQIRSDM